MYAGEPGKPSFAPRAKIFETYALQLHSKKSDPPPKFDKVIVEPTFVHPPA